MDKKIFLVAKWISEADVKTARKVLYVPKINVKEIELDKALEEKMSASFSKESDTQERMFEAFIKDIEWRSKNIDNPQWLTSDVIESVKFIIKRTREKTFKEFFQKLRESVQEKEVE